MKPSFAVLERHYPRKSRVSTTELFNDIGWGDLATNPNFANTCAVRLSVALVKSGVDIPGRMKVESGPYKGKRIETGQSLLSHALARGALLGPPEKFGRSKAEMAIGQRRGIVSFWRLYPDLNDNQGHIDIVSPAAGGVAMCGTDCYWGSGEVWFWPLK